MSAPPHCKVVDASWPSPAGIRNKRLLKCGGRGERPAPRLMTWLNIICARAVQRPATQPVTFRRLPRELLGTWQTGPSPSPSNCGSLAVKAPLRPPTGVVAFDDVLCPYLQARNQDLVQLHGAGKISEYVLPHIHNNEAVQLRWHPIQGRCRHIRKSYVQRQC